jgi:ATP-dependent Clp protease ATP-binding subunit ClpA
MSIGTEHVLLGLLRGDDSVAVRVLASLGIWLDDVRDRAARLELAAAEPTQSQTGQIPFTPGAKKALELALREALALGHNHIGTEHILLGLARANEGFGSVILLEHGASPDAIRAEVARETGTLAGLPPRLPRTPREPPRWQYRVERIANAEALDADALDRLGTEGWELTAMTAAGDGLALVFKRRLGGS